MTSLELIIRPFQSRDVAPPRRIIAAAKAVDPVSVAIGVPGGTAFEFSVFAANAFKVDDRFTYREVERRTHIERIESEADPSQFVEVETVDSLLLRNKIDPEDRRIYEFNNRKP